MLRPTLIKRIYLNVLAIYIPPSIFSAAIEAMLKK
jgi:hypothetical protein